MARSRCSASGQSALKPGAGQPSFTRAARQDETAHLAVRALESLLRTERRPVYAGEPRSRQRHTSAIGQLSHRGARAVQTSAPSSMNAALAVLATAGSSGRIGHHRGQVARVDGGPASACPPTARASTRRTFASTTGCRWPYANTATARAV